MLGILLPRPALVAVLLVGLTPAQVVLSCLSYAQTVNDNMKNITSNPPPPSTEFTLKCSIRSYKCDTVPGQSCYNSDPPTRFLARIDTKSNTWEQFWFYRSGKSDVESGKLKSIDQYQIEFRDDESISRVSGRYERTKTDSSLGSPMRGTTEGTCELSFEDLPSTKF